MNIRFWLRLSIFNLFLVALIGTLMRYKIGFEFPHFSQKNLQHAHSHFAFIGWVTHTIFVLMVYVLSTYKPTVSIKKYVALITANLICSYGMLISFAIQGYGGVSISLSTLSIFIGYAFAIAYFRDLSGLKEYSFKNWFTAALWFNIISSVGTFTLGYMMATHNFDQKIHLGSLYYYLHFQYNGFFFFACIGLFLSHLSPRLPTVNAGSAVFWMFFLSCIPAYFLSVLWGTLPIWLYIIIVAAAIAQLIAWIKFLKAIQWKGRSQETIIRWAYFILAVVACAMTIKFLLQLGSTIPAVSKLAFGFRPIVIAYLHLILLAIISVFLLTFLYLNGLVYRTRLTFLALVLFVIGAYLNELVLGIQGIASFSYTIIPCVNQMLFVIAAMILISVALLLVSQLPRLKLRSQKQIN
jgi:hypothetical protein